MLDIQALTCLVGGEPIFDQASVQIGANRRIGVVGRNGAGKSTLLRLIAGDLQPDSGRISISARTRVGFVEQFAPAGETALIDIVLAADKERAALLDEADTASDPGRIAEIHTRLADIGAHSAPARAASILAGLGFDHGAQQRPVNAFSGGWRMRVALAAALFSAPDLLLLDEPTNHLDLEASIWLERFLAAYPHTFLMVSHDRSLLDRSVDGILHVDAGKLALYPGGFETFARTREERRARDLAVRKRQERERRHIQAFVDRFRAKASKARQAQSRLKLLERMQPIAPLQDEASIRFKFPTPAELRPPILTLDGAAAGYDPGTPVLQRLNLRMDMDDRIGLLGPKWQWQEHVAAPSCKSTRMHVRDGNAFAQAPRRLFRAGPARAADAQQQRLRVYRRAAPGSAGTRRSIPSRRVRLRPGESRSIDCQSVGRRARQIGPGRHLLRRAAAAVARRADQPFGYRRPGGALWTPSTTSPAP